MNWLAWAWGFSTAVCLVSGNWPAAYACFIVILYETGVFQSTPVRRSGEPL